MMKRFLGCLTGLLFVLAAPALVRGASSEDPVPTARYLAAFQNSDGGFGGRMGEPSSLAATSSAIRSLKNVGGSIPDVLASIKYLRSCFDRASGGFAPTPGGMPDVR